MPRAANTSRGDVASPLIYASALLDAQALAEDIEIVAVTGNSMGWYIALAAAGAVSPKHGFTLVNTMGRLMQEYSQKYEALFAEKATGSGG